MYIVIWIILSLIVGIYSGKKRKIGARAGVFICLCTSPLWGYIFISNSPYIDESKNGKISREGLILRIMSGFLLLTFTASGIYFLITNSYASPLTQNQKYIGYYSMACLIILGLIIIVNHYRMLKQLETKNKS